MLMSSRVGALGVGMEAKEGEEGDIYLRRAPRRTGLTLNTPGKGVPPPLKTAELAGAVV
jgi:hypothetical protein